MKTETYLNISTNQIGEKRSMEIKKEQAAIDFEEIFARQMVQDLTKDLFAMDDNISGMGQSNNLYREFITNALSSELATQRKLGFADLITEYWNISSKASNNNS